MQAVQKKLEDKGLTTQLDKRDTTISTLANKLATLMKTNEGLTSEIKKLKEDLAQKVGIAGTVMSNAARKTQELTIRNNTLIQEKEAFRGKVQLSKAVEDLKSIIKELMKDNSTQDDTLTALSREKENLILKNKEINEKMQKLQKLQADNSQFNTVNERLEGQMKKLEAEIASLRANLYSSEFGAKSSLLKFTHSELTDNDAENNTIKRHTETRDHIQVNQINRFPKNSNHTQPVLHNNRLSKQNFKRMKELFKSRNNHHKVKAICYRGVEEIITPSIILNPFRISKILGIELFKLNFFYSTFTFYFLSVK